MDKLKEIRDKNPIADFAAGFIPGVGEAQDLHDLYYSIKDKDYKKAGFFTLGLLLPGITAGQIKKFVKVAGDLPKGWAEKGWKLADDGESFIKDGVSYMRNKDGILKSEKTLADEIKIALKKETQEKVKKTLIKNIRKFDEEAYDFAEKTGFFFDTKSWQAGIPKGMQLTEDQLNDYVTKTGPTIIKHLNTLLKNGSKTNVTEYALRGGKGHWEGWFPDALPVKGKLKENYNSGWRRLTDQEAELYLIQTSPNAAGKFEITGLSMRRGIKPEMFSDFKKGQPQQWYSSNPANSATYSGPNGMQFYAAPVKTNKTNIQPITTSKVNASSNHWTSDKMDPISRHIKGDTNSINISEVPVYDDLSKKKGFFTVLGKDVQVKALKGGTGWFDLKNPNPLAQWILPIGISSTIGIKALNNNENEY